MSGLDFSADAFFSEELDKKVSEYSVNGCLDNEASEKCANIETITRFAEINKLLFNFRCH